MMKYPFVLLMIICFNLNYTFGQVVDFQEAQRRLDKKSGHVSPTTEPTTQATTQPSAESHKKPDHHVVFVVSAGGSMLNVFGGAKDELKRAINHLRPDQTVDLLLCTDQRVLSPNKGKPLLATDENKQRMYAYINNAVVVGSSDIEPALLAAIQERPDVIWVVWNGYGADQTWAEALHKIRAIVSGRSLRINTSLAFADDEDAQASDRLFDLATQNRGVCFDKQGKPVSARPHPQPKLKDPKSTPAGTASPPDDKPSIFQEN